MTSDFDAIERLYHRLGHGISEAATRTAPLLERDPGERAFLTLVVCGAEIDNGGLDQLLTNSTGEVVELGIEGAHHFGLERHDAVLEVGGRATTRRQRAGRSTECARRGVVRPLR